MPYNKNKTVNSHTKALAQQNTPNQKSPDMSKIKQIKPIMRENEESKYASIIKSVLSCPACQKTLAGPLTLNCGHMMCEDCFNGSQEPAASELKCPDCGDKHDLKSSKPLHVDAVFQLLQKLDLKEAKNQISRYCVKHEELRDNRTEKKELERSCRNSNWKLNYDSPEFVNMVSRLDSDNMPYANELVLKSDVFKWKNGFQVESDVCFSEGLRWAVVVTPCRDDGDGSLPKPLNFNLGLICKGWADKTSTKPLTRAKLNVWLTINNLNDCQLTYNSGPRSVKFDNLSDARKRSQNVVCNVMQMNKLKDVKNGWIEGGVLTIVCRFKVPKKMIKLNLAQMQQLGLNVVVPQQNQDATTKQSCGGESSEHRKESTS